MKNPFRRKFHFEIASPTVVEERKLPTDLKIGDIVTHISLKDGVVVSVDNIKAGEVLVHFHGRAHPYVMNIAYLEKTGKRKNLSDVTKSDSVVKVSKSPVKSRNAKRNRRRH